MKKAFLFMTAAILSACQPTSQTIQGRRSLPPPPKPLIPHYEPIPGDVLTWVTMDGGSSQLEFNPQVDILFVIDNSASMKPAQENLSRNINRFVEAFQKNVMIDYNIGVISVWDNSERFAQKSKDPYLAGELRRVKGVKGQLLSDRKVTRVSEGAVSLASTLKIGVIPYEEGGPEVEEVFSPLSQALKKTGRGDSNEEFFRKDAQLVVVVITDADDSTSAMSPEQMAQELIDFKNGRRELVSVYGALVKESDRDQDKDPGLRVDPKYHPECFDAIRSGIAINFKNNGRCKGFGPDRLEQFILTANSHHGSPTEIRARHMMSLTQVDFGSDLAKIGSDITARTLAKEIRLDQRPRLDPQGRLMVQVRYGRPEVLVDGGGQLIPQSPQGGWLFDPENNSVRLSGDIEYEFQPGARFAVDLIPVALRP